jgi:uncharacterized membrane protein HdeD (DUF308 family)
VLQRGLEMVLILIVIILIAANILETVWLRLRHSNQAARTSRLAASIIGIIAGFIGAEHAWRCAATSGSIGVRPAVLVVAMRTANVVTDPDVRRDISRRHRLLRLASTRAYREMQ